MTDDRHIPPAALALGLAGLIPFLWSAATHLSPMLGVWAGAFLPPMFVGAYVGLTYGTVILAFMSGALWGFAARAESGLIPYALSTVPALWAFIMVNDSSTNSSIYLCAGFLGLLAVDASFVAQDLAPRWWLRLRLPLTLVAVACLAAPIVA
jgi:hypothetical protein